MAAKKFKFSEPVSPMGIASSAWLNKPSQPFDGKGEPMYKITLLLEDTAENRNWCQETLDKALAEAKQANVKVKKVYNSPFIYPEDVDEDDFIAAEGKTYAKYPEAARGRIMFTAKSQYKAGQIDAKRNVLPEDVKIMNGDEVKVKVQLNPYEGLGSGVSLRLITVQLIKKNTSYSTGPRTDGFDEEEGYEYEGNGGQDDQEREDF
jgi:hypothetical protein